MDHSCFVSLSERKGSSSDFDSEVGSIVLIVYSSMESLDNREIGETLTAQVTDTDKCKSYLER